MIPGSVLHPACTGSPGEGEEGRGGKGGEKLEADDGSVKGGRGRKAGRSI